MTVQERHRRICAKVSRRIGEIAPEGLGRWDEAWDRVGEPSDRFLDALDAYLDEDTAETRARAQWAADELVRAWRRAAEVWEARGRPRGRERTEVPV